jgi:RND superfamily putative drug exporter
LYVFDREKFRMVTFLYRLGRFSFQHRRWVAASWLLVMVAALAGALTLSGPMTDSFRIPGTPSQEAIDLLGERFPQAAAGGATARVVFAAPAGKTLSDPAYKAAIGNAVAEFRSAPLVAEVSDPFSSGAVNQAGTVGFAQVIFAVPDDGVTTKPAMRFWPR